MPIQIFGALLRSLLSLVAVWLGIYLSAVQGPSRHVVFAQSVDVNPGGSPELLEAGEVPSAMRLSLRGIEPGYAIGLNLPTAFLVAGVLVVFWSLVGSVILVICGIETFDIAEMEERLRMPSPNH